MASNIDSDPPSAIARSAHEPALESPVDHRRALEGRYQVHVPKPVMPAKLIAVLGFLLRQREPAASLYRSGLDATGGRRECS
jgi:hypothetical protein